MYGLMSKVYFFFLSAGFIQVAKQSLSIRVVPKIFQANIKFAQNKTQIECKLIITITSMSIIGI